MPATITGRPTNQAGRLELIEPPPRRTDCHDGHERGGS
jgi:hypothetical protein